MIMTLGLRNLVHDRTRFLAAVTGVSVSVLLMLTQTSIYFGASETITTIVDHSDADIWIMPRGTGSFEDGIPLLTESDRQVALATTGVISVSEVVSSFADWQEPSGTIDSIVVVGSDFSNGAPKPDIAVQEQTARVSRGVIVDRGYLSDLGLRYSKDRASIEGRSVRIDAVSKNMRSFTQSPYVFMAPREAREYLALPENAATFLLVKLRDPSNLRIVENELSEKFQNADVLSPTEFRRRCLDTWLMKTGAGESLIAGTILGALIGIAVVAQTINENVRDHLKEFSLLKGMGARTSYIQSVVAIQALSVAIIGLVIGFLLFLLVVLLSQGTPLYLPTTFVPTVAIFLLTPIMALISSLGAIERVRRIEPSLGMKN